MSESRNHQKRRLFQMRDDWLQHRSTPFGITKSGHVDFPSKPRKRDLSGTDSSHFHPTQLVTVETVQPRRMYRPQNIIKQCIRSRGYFGVSREKIHRVALRIAKYVHRLMRSSVHGNVGIKIATYTTCYLIQPRTIHST
jgi:hypothetical protein